MDLKEEDILGKEIYKHWYYVSKGRAMRSFLANIKVSEAIDIGAGSGIFSRQLLDAGIIDKAICVDPNYQLEKTEEHNGKKISFVKTIDKGSAKLILMMDVLEHVSDDVDLLQQYADNLESGGYILITVPAFQYMWSGHDIFLEHHRRYTIKMIESTGANAGFIPIRSRYYFASLFPLIAIKRIINKYFLKRGSLKPKSDLKSYPKWINSLLSLIHEIERITFFKINRFFGLSVFCLLRKG